MIWITKDRKAVLNRETVTHAIDLIRMICAGFDGEIVKGTSAAITCILLVAVWPSQEFSTLVIGIGG
jgi:hypothetical protein